MRPSPVWTSPAEHEVRWRPLLLRALPLGVLAFLTAYGLDRLNPGQNDAFDRVAYPLLTLGLLVLEGVLLAWPRLTRAVAHVLLLSVSGFFLAKLVFLLFLVSPGVNVPGEITETFFWVPAVYMLSFFMPHMEHGRRTCTAFLLLMTAVGLLAVPSLWSREAWGSLSALVQLTLANVTLLSVTRVFTRMLHERAENLEREALTDALTGLHNGRFLHAHLQDLLGAAQARGAALALVFVDLDGFKGVNDAYGHAAGDALLREVAGRLRAVAREDELLVRLGGDEFVLLAPVRTRAQARERARAAHAAVVRVGRGTLTEAVPPDAVRGVTASVGVSVFPFDAASGEALLAHADAAMYRVKNAGRNGVSA